MATLQLLPPLDALRDPSTRSEAFRQLVEATSQQLYAVVRSIVQFTMTLTMCFKTPT